MKIASHAHRTNHIHHEFLHFWRGKMMGPAQINVVKSATVTAKRD